KRQLDHTDGEVRTFYANLPEPALVGIETTGYTLWFAELMSELGHELAVGDAANFVYERATPVDHCTCSAVTARKEVFRASFEGL
ncbi:MAG: hypothetical protein ACRD28_09900, partial [Acidobacteriaceae bacterium]